MRPPDGAIADSVLNTIQDEYALPYAEGANDAAPSLVSFYGRDPAEVPAYRLPAAQGDLPPRIGEYLAVNTFTDPILVVDTGIVEANYIGLAEAFPTAVIQYAVKANPAAEVLQRLAAMGAHFDVASPAEIDLVLQLGVAPERVCYGNTIKKQRDIAYAANRGINTFAFDSDGELEKLAEAAPGSRVYCRILTDGTGAEWPLSRKFGCSPEMAVDLVQRADAMGFDVMGLSFHPGSQQTDLSQWDGALADAAKVFAGARKAGIELRLLNMGGGFPSRYRANVRPLADYAAAIEEALDRHFPFDRPEIAFEPGRSIVGDAGVIQAEVVLISRKDGTDGKRWVYLDIGKFSGLAETMDEAIKYRILTPRDQGETGPVALAGPTCDSADILYEQTEFQMPLDLQVGDKVLILSTGAYTTTYASVGFNGFPPLRAICI